MPSTVDPPGVPLTAQLTEVLELPDTVAMNGKLAPARMLAVVGEMVTEVDAGVPGLFPLPPELLLELPEPVAAHPMATKAAITAANSTAMIGEHLSGHRMAVRTHLGPHASEISVSQTAVREYWTEGKKKGRDPTGK